MKGRPLPRGESRRTAEAFGGRPARHAGRTACPGHARPSRRLRASGCGQQNGPEGSRRTRRTAHGCPHRRGAHEGSFSAQTACVTPGYGRLIESAAAKAPVATDRSVRAALALVTRAGARRLRMPRVAARPTLASLRPRDPTRLARSTRAPATHVAHRSQRPVLNTPRRRRTNRWPLAGPSALRHVKTKKPRPHRRIQADLHRR